MTPHLKNPKDFLMRITAGGALALTLAACSGGSAIAPNTNSRESLYFPTVSTAPTINGLADDAVWSEGFEYRLEDGAPVAAGTMRGMTDANNVYLHFDVEDDQDTYDVVVLAYNQDGDPANYKRMDIYPCFLTTGSGCSGTAAGHDPTINYFAGPLNGTGVDWAADTAPAGIEVKSNYIPGSPSKWSIEVKLPRTIHSGFPATDRFAFYANAIATDNGLTPGIEFSWPAGTTVGDITSVLLDDVPLNTARWGNASLDDSLASAGLQITGFSSNQENPGQMALNQSNEFFATIGNLSAGGPAPATVNGVNATFKVANFGLPGGTSWTNIPSSTNPTSATPVDPDNYVLHRSGEWNLATTGDWAGSGQSEFDFFTDHPHQCVKVEVNNTSGIPSFTRQYNMDFVTVNSPFKSNAAIAVADWREEVPGAQEIQLRENFANLGRLSWESKIGGVRQSDKRQWALPLKGVQDREVSLDMLIDPDDRLRIPSEVRELTQEGLEFSTKPGSVVTLIVGEATKRTAAIERQKGKRSVVTPQSVVASIDGFETSFPIGSGQSFMMPAGAQRLQVRYVGEEKLEQPLIAQFVATGGSPTILRAVPFMETLRKRKTPVFLPLAINLPFHYVRGHVVTDRSVKIRDREIFLARPMGSFTHAVRSVGPVQVN